MQSSRRKLSDRMLDSFVDLIVDVPLDFAFLLLLRWAGCFEIFGWSNPTAPQLFSIAVAFYVAKRH
jgi:hypothetical protein